MGARSVAALLLLLLAVLHGQLWLGRGSLPQVARMRSELSSQELANAALEAANARAAAEVKDLKEGLDMVEEKARQDLGLVKPNEVFVQISR
jgi:cell division protein FtsB